jgi:hypothetical protein
VTASAALQARIRGSNGFDLVEKGRYVGVLDQLFAVIGDDEEWAVGGIAWETRQEVDRTDERPSYFVLTDKGLYFPVTRKGLFRTRDLAVAVDVDDIYSVTIGQSEYGFLMMDFFDESGAHVAGITLNAMADYEGLESALAKRIARALEIDPDALPLSPPDGALWR